MIGSDQSSLEAAFTGSFGTALDGAEVPSTSIMYQVIAIGGEIAQLIGANASHPYRSYISGNSDVLADLESTPTEDINGNPFVGVYDGFYDSATNQPCTWQPTQTIADIVDNASGFFGSGDQYFYYNINGQILRTTQSAGYLSGCVWNVTDQTTAYVAGGDSPLPDPMFNMWRNGVKAMAVQVGWVDSAGIFADANALYNQDKQFFMMGAEANIPLAARVNPIAG